MTHNDKAFVKAWYSNCQPRTNASCLPITKDDKVIIAQVRLVSHDFTNARVGCRLYSLNSLQASSLVK